MAEITRMSEARLLWAVLQYPHPTALARRVRGASVYPGLRRLEARGLVIRRRGEYRLTRRGRSELAMTRTLARLVARTRSSEA